MPNIHTCEQGTPEWLALRAGLPTASCFDKIVTPTGKLSKSSRDYKAWLLAERVMGRPIVTKQSVSMIRGTEFESAAVEFYEGVKEKKTELIGFVTNEDNTIGASPDRWVGDDGQLEIKVPEAHTHMAYFGAQCDLDKYGNELTQLLEMSVSNPEATPANLKQIRERYDEAVSSSLEREYRVQYTGQLWITERQFSDLLSYSPEGLPPVFVPIQRTNIKPFMDTLAQAVSEFSRDLEEAAADLIRKGIISQDY